MIKNRKVLNEWELNKLDPAKSWIIVIKKDYTKMAAILPNINPTLFNWEDFIPVLQEKMAEKKFDEKDYIVYEIETERSINF